MLYLNRKCDCVPRCSHATLPPRFCRIPLRDVDNFILHSRRRRTDHKPPSIAIDQSQLASFFRFPQPSRSSPLSLPLFLFSSRFCNERNNLPCVLNDYLYAHRLHFLLSEGGFPIQPNFCCSNHVDRPDSCFRHHSFLRDYTLAFGSQVGPK